MSENSSIDTGVDVSNTRIKTTEWEAEAYADNGEHATCWMLKRADDTIIEVATVRCEAGLRERDGPIDAHDISKDKSIIEFGHELANADPELAIELAEEYWL